MQDSLPARELAPQSLIIRASAAVHPDVNYVLTAAGRSSCRGYFLDLAAPPVSTDGVRHPSGLEPPVNALPNRFVHRRVPTRADDDTLGLSVLGDFPEPLVGRDSLVRRADRDLAVSGAGAKRTTTASALQTAKADWTLADARYKAAKARIGPHRN